MSLRDFSEIIALFVISVFLFTWGMGSQEVIGFESRFYLFALEMWRHGVTWFPTTYNQYYADYPATSTWLVYFTALFLGHLDKLAAVIPTAIAAALTVVFTYLIGALHNRRWGLYAICFLLMTLWFMKCARSITLDMFTAFIVTCCFYIIYSGDVKRAHDREWWLYPLFFLGFLFRGPIGLIIPAGVVCIYYLQDRNFKSLFFNGAFALLILIVSMLGLLMVADHVGGDGFVTAVLKMEVVGRMDHGRTSYLFYFINSFSDYALTYPIAVLVALGVIYYEYRLHHHSEDLKLLLKLFGWIAVVMVGMSIPGDKKARYILAIAPALSLMSAALFFSPKSERYFALLRWLLLHLMMALPILLFIAMRLLLSYANKNNLAFAIDYLLITQLMFGAMAVNFLFYICFEKKPHWRDSGILLVAAACSCACYILVAEPVTQLLDGTCDFVVEVERARNHTQSKLVFYREHRDGLPIKYLINMPGEAPVAFVDNEDELRSYTDRAFFITSETYFNQLSPIAMSRVRVIAKDKIGHVPVVVFTLRRFR